jgi:predicted ester cyclase
MSENKAKARRLWEEIFPAMNLDAAAEMLDAAFSDQRFEVHRTVEEGDTVVVHLTHKGTHTGEIMGLAPTNSSFSLEHIHILRFEEGKAVEHWGIHDNMSLMQQLGAIPAPPAARVG